MRRAAVLGLVALCLLTGFVIPAPVVAQQEDAQQEDAGSDGAVMLVMDTSGSMAEDDGKGRVKIEAAKNSLLNFLNHQPIGQVSGLRTYPAGDSGCNKGKLAYPPARRNPVSMSASIRTLTANGDTPTAEALSAAATDLSVAGIKNGTVVLVSDGHSTCADPCEAAQRLNKAGVQVTVHAVGFQVDDDGRRELQCIADATGGTYTDVEDSGELPEVIDKASRAQLKLEVDLPATFSTASAASLTITGTVTNTGHAIARRARVGLSVTLDAHAGGPAVLRPARELGNLAPGAKRTVTWDVHSSATTAGRWELRVVASARNADLAEESGSVAVTTTSSLDDAGPLLKDAKRVVVLGDSFSSGEGADDYDAATGWCHRSPNAYGTVLFGKRATNLAFSGAIAPDFTQRQHDRTVAPQRDQLAGLGYRPDLVLFTFGGNDIGFSSIAEACVRSNCADTLEVCHGDDDCEDVDSVAVVTERLAGLRGTLTKLYQDIAKGAVGTPIVVLPYPELLPNTDRACKKGLTPVFTAKERAFARWIQHNLNSVIEQSVTATRKKGLPLYYATDVQTAMQPNHSVCDKDPWVNQIVSRKFSSKEKPIANPEIVHPNVPGHRAMAAALIRWSNSAAARPPDALGGGYGAPLKPGGGGTPGMTVDLDTGNTRGSAEPGDSVRVTGTGYLPGADVAVAVRSVRTVLGTAIADDDGAVDVTVALPTTLHPGRHMISVAGVGADGRGRVAAAEAEISAPVPWLTIAGAIGLVALVVLGAVMIRTSRRQRA